MSVVTCDLYRIEVSKEAILPVLVELELLKVFEPVTPLFAVETSMYQSYLQSITLKREQAQRAIDVLITKADAKVEANKAVITPEVSRMVQTKIDHLDALSLHIIQKNEALQENAKKLERTKDQLNRFESIKDITLPIYAANSLVTGTVLAVDIRYLASLERTFADLPAMDRHLLVKTDEAAIFAIVYDTDLSDSMQQLISQPYCQELVPSPELLITGKEIASPADLYTALSNYKDELQAELKDVRDSLTEIAGSELAGLITWHDLLMLQEDSLKTMKYVGYTPGSDTKTHELSDDDSEHLVHKTTDQESLLHGISNQDLVHIDGWVDPVAVPLLQERLQQLDVPVSLTCFDASNDPEARTVLHNNRLLRPFEIITNLMGMPNSSEIDPSPYVAPFFILFFGFALGDAGYGLLMVAIVLYFYRKRESYTRQLRNVLGLMMYCGVSTAFFGIISGSWFGLDLSTIGPAGTILASFKVIDLQSNIILLLVASLVTGFIHQLFGLLLAMQSAWLAGRKGESIQVHGTWLLFLLSIGFAFAVQTTAELSSLREVVQPVIIAAFILFVLGQGHGSVWWMRPFKGFLSVFNLTSYLSNTLSYARLLALALATGVIASVVNMIAVMAGGSLPAIIGIPVIALVAIAGHTFNIVLNLLGTFINVARLHLVEFFPRFFEAKGLGLNPLQNEPTYSYFAKNFSTRDMSFDQFKLHG